MSAKINKKLFPEIDGVDIRNVKICADTAYSSSQVEGAEFICRVIARYAPQSSTVTDCTANAGSDSIQLSRVFAHVNAIEKASDAYKALSHNVALYTRRNITVYHGSCLSLLSTIKQDVIYIDAPWGGPSYKKESLVTLKLDGIDLYTVYNLYKSHAKLFVFKVPRNYDLNAFKSLSTTHIHPYVCRGIVKFYIIVI
jgi:16S rRNA G966 N2-methylase RsmD